MHREFVKHLAQLPLPDRPLGRRNAHHANSRGSERKPEPHNPSLLFVAGMNVRAVIVTDNDHACAGLRVEKLRHNGSLNQTGGVYNPALIDTTARASSGKREVFSGLVGGADPQSPPRPRTPVALIRG
jgi:hypothetical protein